MNNYFPHDSNSRNADKMIPVRMKYGAEGYAVYFMLLERLREEKNYMSIVDYNMLAYDLRVDTSLIKAIIEDFGLFSFTENGECFYSEGFNARMEIKDEKSKMKSEAGKKGASKRWQNHSKAIAKPSSEDSKSIALPLNEDGKNESANAFAIKKNSKETKEKETKLNQRKGKETKGKAPKHRHGEFDNVLLTDEELEKLKAKFSDWQQKIDNLSAYIGSTGRAYKSHYITILRWAKNDKNDSQKNKLTNTGSSEYDDCGF